MWVSITNNGLQSITKYSKYIDKNVLDEQLRKHSVLFEALREYYRPNVYLSLTQNSIPTEQNLYDLALGDVVEHGWLSDMKSIENDIAPKRYRPLLEDLRSFHKEQKLLQIDEPNDPVVRPPTPGLPHLPKHDTTNNGPQGNANLIHGLSKSFFLTIGSGTNKKVSNYKSLSAQSLLD